ncbi:MAG: Monofunctional biosynthetic peptidoglycan transglycosylase [Fimbriimonadaceae bacterium]|nr:Monofunctional biosynthetic peptidoglycan transglycosylase [Fimbriimonadaceae bacterium]
MNTKKRRRPWLRRFKIALAVFFIVVVGGAVWASIFWRQQLDKASALLPTLPDVMTQLAKQPTKILSGDGKVLFTISTEYRRPVKIADVPKVVIDATLAAEDKRFYSHSGVDSIALMRTLLTNAREGRVAQGGSTLTMQLAKRVYSEGQKTLQRKIQDMALAVMMENELTKDQILELYLNQVFYGSGAYGIQAAADVYFGKKLEDLTVAEAALLARCVRRPSHENPYANLNRAIENRNVVLGIMREEGMITPEAYEKAKKANVELAGRRDHVVASKRLAPYFVDYVMDTVHREMPGVDISRGGYTVETTINMAIQKGAEQGVRDLVRRYRGRGVRTGAFVVLDREGQILAMVGGADYERNQFNMVAQGKRQPGSAFKPFVYSAAFELGQLDKYDSVSNERLSIRDNATGKTWSPDNSNGKYGGRVSVRSAMAYSINIPAVRTLQTVGVYNAIRIAEDSFGFKSKLDPYLPLALGASAVSPLEMATGYSVFMLGGNRFTPFGVRRVIGPDGQVVLSNDPRIVDNVISDKTAGDIDDLLRNVVTGGTGRRARSVLNARGKTGTTSEHRDAWFCGYTDQLVGIGWIANEQYDEKAHAWVYGKMPGVFGGEVTVQMWREIMERAQEVVGEKTENRRGSDVLAPRRNPEPPVAEDAIVPEPLDEPLPDVNESAPSETGDNGATPDEASTGDGAPPAATKSDGYQAKSEPPQRASVTLEICADSGARASAYCPEVVTRTFSAERAPRRVCRIHGP